MQDGQERVKAIQRHLFWQIAAFVCLLGGFYAIYRNKVPSVVERFNAGHQAFILYMNRGNRDSHLMLFDRCEN